MYGVVAVVMGLSIIYLSYGQTGFMYYVTIVMRGYTCFSPNRFY